MDDREPLGRIVHEIRLAHEADRAATEGRQRFNLPPWEDRDPGQQELDMRIGSAVAAQAVADARIDFIAMRSRLFAIVAELERRAASSVPGVERDTWLAAAAVARGEYGEMQDRSDEKEAGAS